MIRVHQTSDHRYIPAEGKYGADHEPTVDTTYSVPQVAYHSIMLAHAAREPIVQNLLLPNRLLNGHPKIQATAAKISSSQRASNDYQITARHPHQDGSSAFHQPVAQSAYSSVSDVASANLYAPQQMRTYRIQPIYAYNSAPLPTAGVAQYWTTHPDYALLSGQPAFKWSYFQNDFVATNVSIFLLLMKCWPKFGNSPFEPVQKSPYGVKTWTEFKKKGEK